MISLSQMKQDLFAFYLFKEQPGFFVDLGCGDGHNLPDGNNTLLLENNGWTGIGVDIQQAFIDTYNKTRKTLGICADVTQVPIEEILRKNNVPKVIDYLSFDVDEGTEQALKDLTLTDYTFKFITFEHNKYLNPSNLYLTLKDDAKKRFLDAGYTILVEDVCFEPCNGPVEDWYIFPQFFKNDNLQPLNNVYSKDILQFYFQK